MTNSTNNTNADISVNGQKLEEVTGFKYLGMTLCMDGTCLAEVRIMIASTICKQDLAVQHHQLHKQVQALQVSCHPYPLWL